MKRVKSEASGRTDPPYGRPSATSPARAPAWFETRSCRLSEEELFSVIEAASWGIPPPSSTNMRIGFGMKKAWLRREIRRYVRYLDVLSDRPVDALEAFAAAAYIHQYRSHVQAGLQNGRPIEWRVNRDSVLSIRLAVDQRLSQLQSASKLASSKRLSSPGAVDTRQTSF